MQTIKIEGPWNKGSVLTKHTLASVCIGQNQSGYPIFDTTRSEIGEALYQLKYKSDWSKVEFLANAIYEHIKADKNIHFIIPMPASNPREKQPVSEIANIVAEKLGVPIFHNILSKTQNGQSLKDLNRKEDKIELLKDSFTVNKAITNDGKWNVLLIDDLYHTGATMEAACKALQSYSKVNNVYVIALTWR